MIRKSIAELYFVGSSAPMSTVEIDVDSLPEEVDSYSDLVELALMQLADATPDIKATVYVFEGPSINFGEYGHSAFFGVAGSRLVLPALYNAFSNARGLKVRHSEQIRQSQALRQYHIEEGHLWTPEDDQVWSADAEEGEGAAWKAAPKKEPGNAVKAEGSLAPDASITDNEPSPESEDACVSIGSRTQLPARFRAARSERVKLFETVFGISLGCFFRYPGLLLPPSSAC